MVVCKVMPINRTIKILLFYLKWRMTLFAQILKTISVINLSIQLSTLALISNYAYSEEIRLIQLSGGSYNSGYSVWSGHFTAIDGSQWDASEYYEPKNLLFSLEGTLALDINNQSAFILPFLVDAGYESDLYVKSPSIILGGGYVYSNGRLTISSVVTSLLAIGGNVSESPCVDSLSREFHCGSGLPWSDYVTSNRVPESLVSLRFNYVF